MSENEPIILKGAAPAGMIAGYPIAILSSKRVIKFFTTEEEPKTECTCGDPGDCNDCGK